MVGRPHRHINAQALGADETIILDLTNWRHLQALPDDIGLVTSLESLCLAGAPPAVCCASLHIYGPCDQIADGIGVTPGALRRMRQHCSTAGLTRAALEPARAGSHRLLKHAATARNSRRSAALDESADAAMHVAEGAARSSRIVGKVGHPERR